MVQKGGLRVSGFLASLIVSAEALLVCGIALSVDTDARIHATIAAGETIVAAVEGYRRERGNLPPTLDHLVPRYLVALPTPEYGAREWQFDIVPADQAIGDTPQRMALDAGAAGDGRLDARPAFVLSVQLDPNNPATRFRRTPGGCWQLPEFPKCW